MTARPRRIDVVTGPDRRRRSSLAQRRAIVAESHLTVALNTNVVERAMRPVALGRKNA